MLLQGISIDMTKVPTGVTGMLQQVAFRSSFGDFLPVSKLDPKFKDPLTRLHFRAHLQIQFDFPRGVLGHTGKGLSPFHARLIRDLALHVWPVVLPAALHPRPKRAS